MRCVNAGAGATVHSPVQHRDAGAADVRSRSTGRHGAHVAAVSGARCVVGPHRGCSKVRPRPRVGLSSRARSTATHTITDARRCGRARARPHTAATAMSSGSTGLCLPCSPACRRSGYATTSVRAVRALVCASTVSRGLQRPVHTVTRWWCNTRRVGYCHRGCYGCLLARGCGDGRGWQCNWYGHGDAACGTSSVNQGWAVGLQRLPLRHRCWRHVLLVVMADGVAGCGDSSGGHCDAERLGVGVPAVWDACDDAAFLPCHLIGSAAESVRVWRPPAPSSESVRVRNAPTLPRVTSPGSSPSASPR